MSAHKKILCYLLAVTVLILSGCTYKADDEPDITAELIISGLTDEEKTEVGTHGEKIEDFKKLNLELTVKYNKHISDRKISIPEIKEILNSYDIERYWYGGYSTQDNPKEDAEYNYNAVFLAKDLTEEDIKSMFEDSYIRVMWDDDKGREEERSINLSDILVIKEPIS